MSELHKEIPINTLEEALAEIERLKHMLSVARVIRMEVYPPEFSDGRWRMKPVITAIGIDEQEFATEAGKILTACFVSVLMEAQKEATQ